MRIAVLTFEGFNEIASFGAINLLNRVQQTGWKAKLICPRETAQSI